MEAILNDYSIDGQFQTVDEFVDSLFEYTLPLLDCLSKYKIELIKSYTTTYERKITYEYTLYDLLTKVSFSGFPETQKLKILLSQMSDQPYWEENVKTDCQAVYLCETISDFGKNANCITEALERDKLLVSFVNERHNYKHLNIYKNGIKYDVSNVWNDILATEYLMCRDVISISELLQYRSIDDSIVFISNANKEYYSDLNVNNQLSLADKKRIVEDFILLLDSKRNGQPTLKRLVKSIEHQSIRYYEFRTTLSNSQEFRIYFYKKSGKWFFLNSLLKKTQKIPTIVLDKSISLIKEYCLSH